MWDTVSATLRGYKIFNLLRDSDPRVDRDTECYSPLRSLERLLHVDSEFEKEDVVGVGSILFSAQSVVSWNILIKLLYPAETDAALIRWSHWFSQTIEEGEKLVDKHDRFHNNICEGEDETYHRIRLNAIGKCVVNPKNIWWRPLDYLFKRVPLEELCKRYERIGGIVSEVKCELPTNGLIVLRRIWEIGCEWNERKVFEVRCPPTPYSGFKHFFQTDQLTALDSWIRKIKQASERDHPLLVANFHRYLRAVITNFNVKTCNQKLALLELALAPQLKTLFAQEDKGHQSRVHEIKKTKRLVVDGISFDYEESLTDCVYRFKNKVDGKNRFFVFGEKNEVQSHLAWARLHTSPLCKGNVCYSPSGLSFFEIAEVYPIDWDAPPSNVLERLKELEEAIPYDLCKALWMDAEGVAHWLPVEKWIGYNVDKIKLFLYEKVPGQARDLIKKLEL